MISDRQASKNSLNPMFAQRPRLHLNQLPLKRQFSSCYYAVATYVSSGFKYITLDVLLLCLYLYLYP